MACKVKELGKIHANFNFFVVLLIVIFSIFLYFSGTNIKAILWLYGVIYDDDVMLCMYSILCMYVYILLHNKQEERSVHRVHHCENEKGVKILFHYIAKSRNHPHKKEWSCSGWCWMVMLLLLPCQCRCSNHRRSRMRNMNKTTHTSDR